MTKNFKGEDLNSENEIHDECLRMDLVINFDFEKENGDL